MNPDHGPGSIPVQVQPSPGSPYQETLAQPDGSIPFPPGHLYECHDWHLGPSTPLSSIPLSPGTWMGELLFLPPSLAPLTISNSAKKNDTETEDVTEVTTSDPVPGITTQL